jgi:glycosyltransferase involved in cell wall biosynthesis
MPAPISAYIRTLNEARLITRVVEGAKLVADEVIVIDSGSTDGTGELATQAGARVVVQPWLGNGKQKRFAEDQCTHAWVLDLDADEVITPDLAREISALFAHGPPPHPIYETMLVTAPPIGEPWWTFALADRRKLYDKRVVRAPDHMAWDQFEIPTGVTVGKLKAPILHYSFRDLGHLLEKLNRVSGVRARESKLKPFWVVASRVVLAQPFYFLKHYIGRGMWRGGLYGVALAGISAQGRWLRDVKMLEIHLQKRRSSTAA